MIRQVGEQSHPAIWWLWHDYTKSQKDNASYERAWYMSSGAGSWTINSSPLFRGSLVDLRFATFLRIVLEFHRRSCCCHPGFVDGFFGKGARNKKSWAQMAAWSQGWFPMRVFRVFFSPQRKHWGIKRDWKLLMVSASMIDLRGVSFPQMSRLFTEETGLVWPWLDRTELFWFPRVNFI